MTPQFGILLNIVLYNFIALCFFTGKKDGNRLLFAVALIFILFPYWCGDYYHLGEVVRMAKYEKLSFFSLPIEPIYVYLANALHGNYFAFRLVVWTIGLSMTYLSLKKMGLHDGLSFAIVLIVFLLFLSYARAYIGVSFVLYAIVNYNEEKNKIKKVLITLVCLAIGITLHRSMLFLVFVFVLSNYTKNAKWVSLLMIIVVVLSIGFLRNYIMDWALLYEGNYSEDYLEKSQMKLGSYVLGESGTDWTPSFTVSFILQYTPIFYFFLYCVKNYSQLSQIMSTTFFRIHNIFLYIVVVSLLILIINVGSFALFYRLIDMSFIFAGILLAHYIKNNYRAILARRLCLLFVIYGNYTLFYALYCSFFGGFNY